MTFDQILYFMEVARTGNFTLAAEHLYVAQPNITRGILSLERELGVRLFNRTTRKVELTDAGTRLMSAADHYISPFLEDVGSIQSEARSSNIFVVGVLNDEVIPRSVISSIREENQKGENKILIRYDYNADLFHGLLDHQYDLVISSDHRFDNRSEISTKSLSDFSMLIAYLKNDPVIEKRFREDEKLDVMCFADQTFFFSPIDNKPDYDFIHNLNQIFGKAVSVQMVGSHKNALACALSGSGIAVIPSMAISGQKAYPELNFYELNMGQEHLVQNLFWRKEESNEYLLSLIYKICGS